MGMKRIAHAGLVVVLWAGPILAVFGQQAGGDAGSQVASQAAAMEAADRAGDVDRTLESGERILALDPNHRFAQMYVSSRLPERLPADAAARTAVLTRAMDLANKAHSQTEAYFKGTKPGEVTDADWAEQKRIQEARVHDTLGVIHLIRKEYDDSVFMYEYVVTLTPENGLSQYHLGAAYSGQVTEAQEYIELLRQDEAKARAERADAAALQLVLDLRADADKDFLEKRDKAIETLARAAALGGAAAQRARPELERLYRAKNNGSVTGLEELINAKKAELGVR
jgi:tetratricopeptide (TPR) repeat protein